jgi:PAC2 family
MNRRQPYELHERPPIESPVLIVMLQGWIDASTAAAGAMAVIEEQTRARTIATFDRDTFIDYRARRPVMELHEGLSSKLTWPDIELKCGRDSLGNDLLILSGHEPDSAWAAFADAVTQLAMEFNVRLCIGLGAYPFQSPHTRPPQLSCTTPDPELLATVSYLKSSLEAPAGMEAVLEHAMFARGIPSIGLWAQVPSYVAAMSFPAASVALVGGLNELAKLDIPMNGLRGEALLQRTRLDELVSKNDEHKEMVLKLELEYDYIYGRSDNRLDSLGDDDGDGDGDGDGDDIDGEDNAPIDPETLPSGDELAEELEQYLRDQETG